MNPVFRKALPHKLPIGTSLHSLAKFQPHLMLGPASISGASLRRAPPPVTAHVWPPTSCPLFRSANSRATEGNVSSPYGRTGCRSYATDPPRSDTPAPSNAPQMGSNVTCIKSPEGDQSANHPQLRPVGLLQSFATTLKGGILVPDRFSPTHAAIQLVRFVSTALTYLATIPVYAATLPIRQMMPRPLARHQHIFLRQHDDFFFTTTGLNSSQQPSGCTSSPGRM